MFESAIEKQPACAAPISSSGFVPGPSSKRERNENWPSKAPEPSAIVPAPLCRSPLHFADAVRTAMAVLLLVAISSPMVS